MTDSVATTERHLRNQISEILIKWGMPTRQVAISEILQLFNEDRSHLIQRLEKEKRTWTDEQYEIERLKPCNSTCHNQQIDELVQIIREEGLV